MSNLTIDELPPHLDPQCLLISNLNHDTDAETLYKHFNRIADVDRIEIDVDDQERSKGSAIILFVQALTDFDIILSKIRIDGKFIEMAFAPKGFSSTHPWRDMPKKMDRITISAEYFSLGTMLAPKTFVDMWSCVKNVRVTMDFGLRYIYINFQHLDSRYRMDFSFNNIDGEMKMERDGLTTHLTFALRYPARVWRELIIHQHQQPIHSYTNSRHNNHGLTPPSTPPASPALQQQPDTRASKRSGTRIWERTMDIPLNEDARVSIIQESNQKRLRVPATPEFPLHRVNLATWRTYRIRFEPPQHMLKDFEIMLQSAAEFNLISRGFNLRRQRPLRVLLASQLPEKPHSHSERARKIENFDVLYYLECAISQGLIDEINLGDSLYEVLNEINSISPEYPRGILKTLLEEEKSRVWKPLDAISKVFDQKGARVISSHAIPEHCVLIHKVIVTPTTMYLQPPTLEVSNRVIRQYSAYSDRFLRVQFVDEGMTRISAAFATETSDAVYARIFKVLQRGIQIGARRYDFLAFSSSQLRGHGCWFFAPTVDLSCGMIRNWMGSFSHVKIVAKNAVRMGQCFSTTIPTILLSEKQVEVIDDIERNGFTFSDGVGKISPTLMRDVAQNLELDNTPSCIQFRLAGAKGVLSLSNYLNGRKIQLRPSQIKFDSPHTMLEVIRTSQYLPAYLNRQVITLLSSLGIKDHVFMQMTQKMVNSMANMLSNPSTASNMVYQNMDEHGNTNTMARIIDSGFLGRRDPYILNMLNVFRVSKLKDLKEKARIHVPNGAFLLGILDETGSLEEGEIYVRISDPTSELASRRKPPVVGPCVIFRNPCFHPGDVRTVVAVDCEKLRHLYDVVVFSAKGFRDLPSMLSGGDLDGDDFTVIWDNSLLPTKSNYHPLSYQSEEPLQVENVNINHIMKFFVNYINNDNLGQIANSHLAIADKSSMGAKDGRCVRLAQLHSLAVDFPKTGRPAKFENDLRTTVFPDFMQKPDKESYESDKILGRMFRYINSSDYEKYRETLLEEFTYDPRLWLEGMAEYIAEARETQARYNRDVWALMNQYGVYTEAELVSGYVMEWKKKTSTRKSMFEQTNQVVKAVKYMQNNYRKEFLKTKQNTTVMIPYRMDGDERQRQQQQRQQQASVKDDLDLKAAAWYYVTYHPKERSRLRSDEASLFSFPWVVYDYICAIAVRNTKRQVEQKMLDPIDEHIIDMHRPVPEAGLQVSLDHVESDDESDEDEEEEDEEEKEEDEEDLDEEFTMTFKISDLKKEVQEQPRQQQQSGSDFNVNSRNYVDIGVDASEEDLENQLLSL